jgi:hypothetical protein
MFNGTDIPRADLSEWTSEFQFRASGQERGSGNLQLWYVKDGESSIGASSIYTVGQFDGFVLTIDTHGGRVSFCFFFLYVLFETRLIMSRAEAFVAS